jgi:predicted DNA binding CopG/RHH family protein
MKSKKPPLPAFASDEEAEAFVATADLTAYDLSGAVPVRYEFQPKGANISMRMPQQLLDDVKRKAAKEGIPYQRFIRQTLEQAVAGGKKAG